MFFFIVEDGFEAHHCVQMKSSYIDFPVIAFWHDDYCILQVPRVFINQKFVGGGDDVVAKDKSGQLKALLA